MGYFHDFSINLTWKNFQGRYSMKKKLFWEQFSPPAPYQSNGLNWVWSDIIIYRSKLDKTLTRYAHWILDQEVLFGQDYSVVVKLFILRFGVNRKKSFVRIFITGLQQFGGKLRWKIVFNYVYVCYHEFKRNPNSPNNQVITANFSFLIPDWFFIIPRK